jgi:hypothetical protein
MESSMLQAQIDLLRKAEQGQLENLVCPQCGWLEVSVWFSHPADDLFRTWFLCSHCAFHFRAQNGGRPTFFSEDRILPELEKRDQTIADIQKFSKSQSPQS